LIGHFAGSPEGQQFFTLHSFYWLTGGLSSVLDNAPTYASFLAAACGKFGMDVNSPAAVATFAYGAETSLYLAAISVAAVFFGAMTYIGNGPNFMVKSIAEQRGLKMPTFGGYIVYSVKYLLPVLVVVWAVFFVGLT
jgi:Na+/H+ antiporter NhaD/arsenite permease-like protein